MVAQCRNRLKITLKSPFAAASGIFSSPGKDTLINDEKNTLSSVRGPVLCGIFTLFENITEEIVFVNA